ncbi:HlyD family efflux transporter periplasmic adaptor subunit [Sporohalobacter salinus]|uniref:HlyD family efflux transporter periplasmic adaptor subunit n=1 Tax=Sporohalobacter salinus TaxID=1494606 RepID=UPI00195F41B7|nr:putative membrane fusion protein [Sporohalobacter salinus]
MTRGKSNRNKVKQKSSTKEKKFNLTHILVIIIVSIIGLSIIFNLFIHATDRTILTKYGEVTDEFQTRGLFVRDESVTIAPISGKLDLKVKAGTRVQASTLVAQIKHNRKKCNLYSRHSGLVSYHSDGLESTLKPEILDQLTYKQFQKLGYKGYSINNGIKVNNGRPIFKIVNNFLLYLVVPISKDKSSLFESGMKIEFELPQKTEDRYAAQIDRILHSRKKDLLVLNVKRFISKFMKLRKVEVNLIRSSYNGIVVPVTALINKKEKTGVMVVKNQQTSFKEVKIVGKNRNRAVIKGVEIGVKILRNPE